MEGKQKKNASFQNAGWRNIAMLQDRYLYIRGFVDSDGFFLAVGSPGKKGSPKVSCETKNLKRLAVLGGSSQDLQVVIGAPPFIFGPCSN